MMRPALIRPNRLYPIGWHGISLSCCMTPPAHQSFTSLFGDPKAKAAAYNPIMKWPPWYQAGHNTTFLYLTVTSEVPAYSPKGIIFSRRPDKGSLINVRFLVVLVADQPYEATQGMANLSSRPPHNP